jgi:hypothetical protein
VGSLRKVGYPDKTTIAYGEIACPRMFLSGVKPIGDFFEIFANFFGDFLHPEL